MNRQAAYLLVVLVVLFQSNVALSQSMGAGMGMGMGAAPSGTRENPFPNGPQLGDPVQDMDIFDDEGNPVNVREIATGQYTVLVLGCLT